MIKFPKSRCWSKGGDTYFITEESELDNYILSTQPCRLLINTYSIDVTLVDTDLKTDVTKRI